MKQRKNTLMVSGVDYISNSALLEFRRCPYRFDLQYRKKIHPIYTNISLYFGQVMHQAMDYYYTEGGRDIDKAKEYFEAAFEGGLEETPVRYNELPDNGRRAPGAIYSKEEGLEVGIKCLDKYYDEYFMDTFEVLSSEKDYMFEIDLGEGIKINSTAILDKIIQDEKGVWIMDHKFVTRTPNKKNLDVATQITFYYMVAQMAGYKPVGAIYDYVMKHKTPKCQRYYVTRTQEQIDQFKTDLRESIKAIRDGRVYRNYTDQCDFCSYYNLCVNNDMSSFQQMNLNVNDENEEE